MWLIRRSQQALKQSKGRPRADRLPRVTMAACRRHRLLVRRLWPAAKATTWSMRPRIRSTCAREIPCWPMDHPDFGHWASVMPRMCSTSLCGIVPTRPCPAGLTVFPCCCASPSCNRFSAVHVHAVLSLAYPDARKMGSAYFRLTVDTAQVHGQTALDFAKSITSQDVAGVAG